MEADFLGQLQLFKIKTVKCRQCVVEPALLCFVWFSSICSGNYLPSLVKSHTIRMIPPREALNTCEYNEEHADHRGFEQVEPSLSDLLGVLEQFSRGNSNSWTI